MPPSFIGDPRYKIQNYQDSIAICRYYGHLDLFIIFICNAQWPEIQTTLNIISSQRLEDRSDIVSRVFKIKLEELMLDITKKQHFKKLVAGTILFIIKN